MGLFRRRQAGFPGQARRGGGRFKITLIIGILVAGYHVVSYYSNTQYNEITGEKQRIGISQEQEIALGLQSAPAMAQQHGGLHPDKNSQLLIDKIGKKLVDNTVAKSTGYEFDFHLLADAQVVNAFALPGGQVFITQALYSRLTSKDQLAGVLGHEIGHVIARHSAERIAKQQLTQGLTGAAVLATGDYGSAQMAQLIGSVVGMKYGREQELESDDLGVRLMVEAGYNPEALIGVMKILKEASGGGDGRKPEFFSTHPNPENRVSKIQQAIKKYQTGYSKASAQF